jgi:hypothetical protein
MALRHYFDSPKGSTFPLTNVQAYPADLYTKQVGRHFPDIVGLRNASGILVGYDENGLSFPVTRRIEYKSYPSKHECDARCMFASGKVMKCECACGGRNHGKGHRMACA